MRDAGRYKSNFTRAGLMVPESRVVADLLLTGVDADAWRQAIEIDMFRHGRSEVIIWPLQGDTGRAKAGGPDSPDATKRRRRIPSAALTGKVHELGDVMRRAPPSDWGLNE